MHAKCEVMLDRLSCVSYPIHLSTPPAEFDRTVCRSYDGSQSTYGYFVSRTVSACIGPSGWLWRWSR